MTSKKKKHDDTSVSLHPLTLRDALKKIVETPPEKPSRRTKSAARGRSPKPKRTARRRSAS